MKCAIIAPPGNLLSAVERHGGSYHMALGQHLATDPKYLTQFERFRKRGDFIIVDNGAAENDGSNVPFRDIVEAARVIRADEIVLPDVLKDKDATLKRSTNPHTLSMVPPKRRMVVPQGRDWEEWRECLETLTTLARPASIGVPKWLESLPGGRAHALDYIYNRTRIWMYYNIHLLGIYRKPFSEVQDAVQISPDIRGIDTGAPIAWAQRGVPFNEDFAHHSLQWKDMEETVSVLRNINRYTRFVEESTL